jgi:hypothetical protein
VGTLLVYTQVSHHGFLTFDAAMYVTTAKTYLID